MAEDALDIAARYAELAAEKKELDAKLREVKGLCEAEAEKLLLVFQERGIDRITVKGQTLYPYARIYLSLKDKGRAAEVSRLLAEAGLEDAVILGTQRLTSVYNEDPDTFPPQIADLFNATERWYVGARKAD